MNSNQQQGLKLLIILVAAIGALAAILMLAGVFDGFSGKFIGITFSMLYYGIMGCICHAVIRKKEYYGLGIAGIAVAAAGFLLNLLLILLEKEIFTADFAKVVLALLLVSLALAHISFLFYINIQNKYAALARTIAVIFISLFTFLIVVKLFDSFDFIYMRRTNEGFARVLIASLITDLTATLLVPLCNQLRFPSEAGFTFDTEPITGTDQETKDISV